MGRRLTRKEIVQEDKIHSTLSHLWDWSARNSKLLVAGLVLIMLSIIGAYFWQGYQRGHDEELQAQFAQALKIYSTPVVPNSTEEANTEATTDSASDAAQEAAVEAEPELQFKTAQERDQKALEAFQNLAEQYSGTRIEELSLYYVGLTQQRLGQPEEADTTIAALIDEAASTEIKNLARKFQAQLALLENNHQKAIELYRQILEDAPSEFPRQTILMQLAQSYEATGQPQEAVKYYKQLTTDYPSSEYSRQAQTRLDLLGG
ncbi:MAG: tetratricopeptide repeat protein [Acidobacteriota bacterium]